MKRTLQGLGIGLFLAGTLYTVLDYLQVPATPENAKQYQEQIHALEQQLSVANEQIALLEKAQSAPVKKEASNATPTKESPADNDENNATVPSTDQQDKENTPTEPAVSEETIYIYEGVSLYDIGKQVEDAGIIENGRELELFLSKPEYAKSIQKGQFELSSAMTIEEIALILTGQPKQD